MNGRAGPALPGRVGPNAITQVATALERAVGRCHTRELFESAGLDGYLAHPPDGMVAEREVIALHAALRRTLPPRLHSQISLAAGQATGDYLLRCRIPRVAQHLLHAVATPWGTRLLVGAIRRHAWTFTGSGRLRLEYAPLPVFVLEDCPLCRDARHPAAVCGYFAATFERLFQRIIDPGLCVTETHCAAQGERACRFALSWMA
jgi:divinyl protochlorophyllide a 8-vinyl-reductase